MVLLLIQQKKMQELVETVRKLFLSITWLLKVAFFLNVKGSNYQCKNFNCLVVVVLNTAEAFCGSKWNILCDSLSPCVVVLSGCFGAGMWPGSGLPSVLVWSLCLERLQQDPGRHRKSLLTVEVPINHNSSKQSYCWASYLPGETPNQNLTIYLQEL